MIKKHKTIIILFAASFLVAAASLLFGGKKSTPEPSPTPEAFVKPTGDQIQVKSSDGGDVTVDNFYKSSIADDNKGSAGIEQTDKFQINYIYSENTFYIDILSSDFEGPIPAAEAAFLKKMGISKYEACKLNVKVRANPAYIPGTTEVRPLSFCSK